MYVVLGLAKDPPTNITTWYEASLISSLEHKMFDTLTQQNQTKSWKQHARKENGSRFLPRLNIWSELRLPICRSQCGSGRPRSSWCSGRCTAPPFPAATAALSLGSGCRSCGGSSSSCCGGGGSSSCSLLFLFGLSFRSSALWKKLLCTL